MRPKSSATMVAVSRSVRDGRASAAPVPGSPEPAVAPPPGHVRFPLFDSLRAIAALSVLVFHATQVAHAQHNGRGYVWWESLFGRLNLGVTIFFLISGFLLYRPFVAGRLGAGPVPRIRDFARRRVLRIVPAYWLAMTLLIPTGLLAFPGGYWPQVLQFYGFGQIYSEQTFPAGLGVAWSLCVEASFYLVLPLYAALVARLVRGRACKPAVRLELAGLAALAALSLAFSVVAHDAGLDALADTLPGTFSWFALGMALAVISAAGSPARVPLAEQLSRSASLSWGLAAVVLLLTATVANLPGVSEVWPLPYTNLQWGLERALYGIVALLLLLPAVFHQDGGGWPRRLLGWRPLLWLGLVSYGIYLWHAPFMGAYRTYAPASLFSIPGPLVFLQFLLLAGVGAIVAGALSYRFVERPALRYKEARFLTTLGAALRAWGAHVSWRHGEASVRIEVAGGPRAAGAARGQVAELLSGKLDPRQLGAMQLVVTELVTNSVRHGDVGPDGRIWLDAEVRRNMIRVNVRDTGRQGVPRLLEPDIRSGRGFGLHLVDRLTTRWGAMHTPDLNLWFELPRTTRWAV